MNESEPLAVGAGGCAGGGGAGAAREAVAAVDHAWLRMDEPCNLMQINGVLVLARPVDLARVKAIVTRRLLPIRRFRQRVAGGGQEGRQGGAAAGNGPWWHEDADFDLDRHVLEETLPAPGDDRTLEAAIGRLMSAPLPADRPLWELRLFQGYGGGSALLARIHHAIGDGVALMLVLLSLTDMTPAGGPPAVTPAADTPNTPDEPDAPDADADAARADEPGTNPFTDLFCHPAVDMEAIRALAGRLAPELLRLLQVPAEAVRRAPLLSALASVPALGRLTGRPADPATAFRGPLGVPKMVAWSAPVALAEVKEIGRVLGGTVNDVLVAATAGALRRYLAERPDNQGRPLPRRLDIRAAMPVNLRPLDRMSQLGNHFGLIFLALPLGLADPLERLAEVGRRSRALRQSAEPLAVYGILRAMGRIPLALQRLAVRIFATKATLVMTNVPGPVQPLYLAGTPIRDIFFWVPQSGHVGLGVSILSYNGTVRLGLGVDAGLVPDPQPIVEGFHDELDQLLRLARATGGPAGEPAAPPASAP